MVLGCFELLLLLGIIAGLLILLGRYPGLGKILFLPLRNRRISGWQLLAGAFFLGFLAFVLSEKASRPGHAFAAVMYCLFYGAAVVLFLWALLRFLSVRVYMAKRRDDLFLGLPIAHDPPAHRPPLGHPQETPVDRTLPGEFAHLFASLAAAVSRLSLKDLLIVSFLLVAPITLALAVTHSPPSYGILAVFVVFFFFWAVCFAVFCSVVWLVQKFFVRGACPTIGQLKDLLAERLPAAERARLATHLESCPVCQHRVEGLTAGHHSWPGMAHKLYERPAEPEPALRKVMDRLKEGGEEATRDEPALAGDLPLGFLSPSDKPGQLGRLERYEVLEEIGRGGMGVVLKAFDPSLHRVVAIKVLAPQLATSGVARKRFLREAKAAAAVTHDHIVTIHAVEEFNGLPYLVMQYVPGQSLQERIDKDGPLELPDILRIGMQTASALAAAHAHGIVHRDIKPANILLEEGVQRVKITDFGLARAMDDASLTQSGFVAGSPLYMAPEQARGEALDHRADLFSLGSVLYTMCTGRPPFRAANTLAVLRRVSEDSPRPIRETHPEIPDWLADVIAKLMAKEPTERFASAAEVEEVLGRNLAQLQHATWVPPPRPPAPAARSDVAGLPTSLTICPSCGASLQVPERMVGGLVHCSECGKPFHVEEGSEVMQVARPARWPQQPREGLRRKSGGCLWIAGGAVVFFVFLLLLFVIYMRSSYEEHAETAALRQPHPPWKRMLEWLPAEATLFGGIDLKSFGSLSLDDPPTQALLRLIVPEAADDLTPENFGRIRIDGAALACYEDAKSGRNEALALLEGQIWSGRKRILDFLHQNQTDLRVKESKKPLEGLSGKSALISGPSVPFALHLRDDQHVFLARSLGKDATEAKHMKALERLPEVGARPAVYLFSGDNLSGHGYNPPWIYESLAKIPPNACGAFLGEIPDVYRKALTDFLKLRVCPHSFVFHMRRQGQDIVCSLTLNLDKAGTDAMLRDDLEQWRLGALNELQVRFPLLKKDRQGSTLLGQILNSMRWKTGGGKVQTEIKLTGPTSKDLSNALTRISRKE
jgi:hypothetical protein